MTFERFKKGETATQANVNPKLLPASFVRLIAEGDRQALGLKTSSELVAAAEVKSERQLQSQIANLLSLRDIVYTRNRMDRKSTTTVGWPDFCFSVRTGEKSVACAWEIKMPHKELEAHQVKLRAQMTSWPNAWHYRVIHSVDEALAELRKLGL